MVTQAPSSTKSPRRWLPRRAARARLGHLHRYNGAVTTVRTRGRLPVSWFELFYDLAIVATLVAINDAFLDEPSAAAAVTAAIAAASLFTVWLLTTLAVNTQATMSWLGRALTMAQMAALIWLVAALSTNTVVPAETGLIAFSIALMTVGAMWWRRGLAHRTSVTLGIAAAIALAGVFLPPHLIWVSLGAATLVASVPAVYAWTNAEGPELIESSHLAERMGLFVLFVLGLSFGQLVVDMGQADTVTDVRFFVLMFLVMFAIWWMYFELKVPEHPMATGPHRRAWITAHYLLLIGVAAVGDIISALTSYPDSEIAVDGAAYLGLGLALVLVGIALLVGPAQHLGRGTVVTLVALAALVIGTGVLIDILDAVDLRPVTLAGAAIIIVTALALGIATRHSGNRMWRGEDAP